MPIGITSLEEREVSLSPNIDIPSRRWRECQLSLTYVSLKGRRRKTEDEENSKVRQLLARTQNATGGVFAAKAWDMQDNPTEHLHLQTSNPPFY